jgi:hypothetical protein
MAMTVKIMVFWVVTSCSCVGRYILKAQAASIFKVAEIGLVIQGSYKEGGHETQGEVGKKYEPSLSQ